MKDFLLGWLYGAAVCAVCALIVDVVFVFVGFDQPEWWRQLAFVGGVPALVSAITSLVVPTCWEDE